MFFIPPPPPSLPVIAPIVTVWVHGTKPSEVVPPFVKRFMHKHEKIVFDCAPGLHKASDLDLTHYSFALAYILSLTENKQFPWEHFYIFGWSGKLEPQERKKASGELLTVLRLLSQQYEEKFQCKPIFVLLSHSHGGNVILGMANLLDSTTSEWDLVIDKAILLACPVQKHTNHCIASSLFKRIYSIHSHTDIIQIIDLQGLHIPKKISYPLLSERHFTPHPKLVQVCIRWKNGAHWHPDDHIINTILLRPVTKAINFIDRIKSKRGLLHIEFKLLPFIRQLPGLLITLDTLFDCNGNCACHKDQDDITIEL